MNGRMQLRDLASAPECPNSIRIKLERIVAEMQRERDDADTVRVTLPKDDYEALVRDAMLWRKRIINRDAIARAIWESYWADQSETWIREHWEANAKMGDGDRAQRVPYILADVIIEYLKSAAERSSSQ